MTGVRATLERFLASRPGVAVTEHEAKGLLRALGLPVPRGIFLPEGDTLPVPLPFPFPVVAKAAGPGLTGKSDRGGVTLGIRDGETLLRETARLRKVPGATGVLVEEEAPPGVEVIVGGGIDPEFGPVVMFGLGGIYVEILRDVAFALAPLTEREALALFRRPKGATLLAGVRGRPPVDFARLAGIMVTVSELMATGLLAGIDLNPVALYPAGALILDAKILPV